MSTDEQKTPSPTLGVPVTLDRERHLRYTFGTRRRMIEEFGGEEAMKAKMSGDGLIKILTFGLRGEDPDITESVVEEMVDMQNVGVVVDAMIKALGYTKGKLSVDGAPVNPRKPRPAADKKQ